MAKKLFPFIDKLAKAAIADKKSITFHSAQKHAIDSIFDNLNQLAKEVRKNKTKQSNSSAHNAISFKNADRGDPVHRAETLRRSSVHNVFVIDGDRGSGKTSTLQNIIRKIKKNDRRRIAGKQNPPSPAICIAQIPLIDRSTSQFSAIETVFAVVERILLRKIEDQSTTQLEKDALNATIQELHEHVIVGWTFSRNDGPGMNALINDAVDYADYARQRATFNIKSASRGIAWSGFIERFLDTMGYDLFVPVFDDIDLHAASAHNVVEDIKEYLSHPRIAVLAAFDMENLWNDILASHYYENKKEFNAQLNLMRGSYYEPDQDIGTFLIDLHSQRCKIARADLIKTFPAAYRYNIRLNQRNQIDNLLPEWSLSKICVHQFLLHAMSVCEILAPLTNNKNHIDSKYEKYSWWFLNAEYSQLITDNVRTYIQFLHQISLSSINKIINRELHGSRPINFPVLDHENTATAIARYHGLTTALRHFSSWGAKPELLFVATETYWSFDVGGNNDFQQGVALDDGDSDYLNNKPVTRVITDYARVIHGLCTRREERYIDFIADIYIAANNLDAKSIAGLSQWLPKNISFTKCKKGRRHSCPHTRYGVNGIYPEQVLPRSCLYIYQLRHIDQLAFRLRRKFNQPQREDKYDKDNNKFTTANCAPFFQMDLDRSQNSRFYIIPKKGDATEQFRKLDKKDKKDKISEIKKEVEDKFSELIEFETILSYL